MNDKAKNSDKPKGIEEGPRIWVESLLSSKEYAEQAKKYPKSYTKGSKPADFFRSDYEWRWGMGSGLSTDAINLINKRMDDMLKMVKDDQVQLQKAL